MPSNSIRNTQKSQTGAVLIESIIAMVIVGILTAGPAYVMARANFVSTSTRTQIMAISQMKNIIYREGASLCTNPAAPQIRINEALIKVKVLCTQISWIKVGPVFLDNITPAITLTLTDDALFDGQPLSVGD
jgi:Tfp pilus assembly protein PilE